MIASLAELRYIAAEVGGALFHGTSADRSSPPADATRTVVNGPATSINVAVSARTDTTAILLRGNRTHGQEDVRGFASACAWRGGRLLR